MVGWCCSPCYTNELTAAEEFDLASGFPPCKAAMPQGNKVFSAKDAVNPESGQHP